MMDRAEAARVTIDRHIVRRVGEHDRGAFVAQQRRKGGEVDGPLCAASASGLGSAW